MDDPLNLLPQPNETFVEKQKRFARIRKADAHIRASDKKLAREREERSEIAKNKAIYLFEKSQVLQAHLTQKKDEKKNEEKLSNEKKNETLDESLITISTCGKVLHNEENSSSSSPTQKTHQKRKTIKNVEDNDKTFTSTTMSPTTSPIVVEEEEKNVDQVLNEKKDSHNENEKLSPDISSITSSITSSNTLHDTPESSSIGAKIEKLSHTSTTPKIEKVSPPPFPVAMPKPDDPTSPLPILAKPKFGIKDFQPYSLGYVGIFSLMTPQELENYKKANSDPTIAEIEAINLLEDMLYGNANDRKTARRLYWEIQKAQLKNVEKHAKTGENAPKGTILEGIMDGIEVD